MKWYFTLVLFIIGSNVIGQNKNNDFNQYYPLGEDPGLRFMSSYTPQETILFEASPYVYYSFYNDFLRGLRDVNLKHTQAWYLSFRPQFRVYTDIDVPIRTPSFKIHLGTQHLFRLDHSKSFQRKYWGFSFESGHFSNGQNGSSFSEKYNDGTKQSDSMYTLINSSTDLSKMLNRTSGNFSVNLTELFFTYRDYRLDTTNQPKQIHAINLGYIFYHRYFFGTIDRGGITRNDAAIIGQHRFEANYKFEKVVKRFGDRRFSVNQHVEYIFKTHPFINPLRIESSGTFYPFLKARQIGLVLSFIYGHDNYNYRVVDSGTQFSFGITWNQFPPFAMNGQF